MIKKFFGWFLFFIGLAIIGYSLYSSYNIFTGLKSAPEIFKIEEKKEILIPTGDELEIKIQKMISEQLKGILPVNAIPQMLNLVTWSIFSGILIFGGAQIASLGIKLLKG